MKYLILLLLPYFLFAQYDPKENEYQHFSILSKNDTIHYHIYSKNRLENSIGFILFIQGSGTESLLKTLTITDTIKSFENGIEKNKIVKTKMLYSAIPFDLDRIPDKYAFVLISKKGIPFIVNADNFKTPKSYFQTESLDYRVWQGNEVIKDITRKFIKKPKKVMVIGHSEGSDVVAKLGTINKIITHIGFWSGGGNTQYYDFTLFIQKEVQKGKITQEEANKQLEALFVNLKKIEMDPMNIDKEWEGNTYKRWSTFNEAPIDNLLKINIPIFVAVGGKDEAVPVESSLLIPVEFIRHHKDNLTYKLYPDYNHSFAKPRIDESSEWNYEFVKVLDEFIEWAENTKKQ